MCIAVHIHYYLTTITNYSGAAISVTIANWCQPVILIVYIRLRKLDRQTWGGNHYIIIFEFFLCSFLPL